MNLLSSRQQPKHKETIFKTSDFEEMLKAKEAFLHVQGKEIHPDLKHKLSKKGMADMVEDIADGEVSNGVESSTRAAPTIGDE